MGNYKVYECKGIFTDSDLGQTKGDYAHNERYIFTVCVPGGDYVSLQFDSFCTEKDVDFIQFYDGRDTFASKIGPRYHGTNKPTIIKSTDSCITAYFQSDASVACYGWKANWSTKVLPLPNPKFVNKPQVSCSTSVIRVKLDQKFLCSQITDTSFTLNGLFAPGISKVIPINCVNNLTDSFEIQLASGMNRGGSYTLGFKGSKLDICDSLWILTASVVFSITDCPIVVDLNANPLTICEGGCTDLTAIITGGDSTKYMYTWNNSLTPTKPPKKVCPAITTTYTLTVSDGVAVPGMDSVTVTVKPKPTAPKDTSVCQSGGGFSLSGTPAGGTWQGKGITNNATGQYNPGKAGAGKDTVTYWVNGCPDTVIVDVRGIYAGSPNAACPGASPFNVTGYSPAGGTWSGPKITPAGQFNPDTAGTYVVTYTWNGCSSNKTINVQALNIPQTDTVCLSAGNITLSFSPVGGFWSGPGITNSSLGIFNTNNAGTGNKNLIYTMNGCKDTLAMRVENINSRGNQVVCLSQSPFTLLQGLPAGGYWRGKGVADSATGLYDPKLVGKVANDTIEYVYGGCTAPKIMYLRNVYVYIKSKGQCIEEPQFILDWNSVQVTPWGGTWTGNGIVSSYYFNAANAGYGTHKLIYDFNGCLDSTTFTVYPKSNIQKDTTFCQTDPQFTLFNGEGSGYFKGKGITDTAKGYFRPSVAGVGKHRINYYSKFGCKDSFEITVTARPVVSLSGVLPLYCFKDSLFNLSGTPAGGNFWGAGVNGASFNPKKAGTGVHKIYYQFGTPTCYRVDSAQTTIGDTLKVKASATKDSLCPGGNTQLQSSALGGLPANYQFNWSNGQSGKNAFEAPQVSGYYYVTLTDACSDQAIDSILITVHPKVTATITTSAIQCYGQNGYARIEPGDADPYIISWRTNPPFTGNKLNAPVTNTYYATVTNNRTGCTLDTFARIPGHPKIKAYFITIPREGICIDPFNPVINIINQSTGADSGTWNLGDGTTIGYQTLLNPSHTYAADTTKYIIKLVVYNTGGCSDSMTATICLNDSVYALIPNAFTPNNNNFNETFKPIVAGANEYLLQIFNRWGEKVFETDRQNIGWDGTFEGNPCQNGIYLYVLTYKGKKTITRQEKGTLLLLR